MTSVRVQSRKPSPFFSWLKKRRGSSAGGEAGQRLTRKQTPIVPPENIAGRAMVLVIAIMSFLSCLMLGAVTLVRDTAATWQTQIAREATIQIKPVDGLYMEAALTAARNIAVSYGGVRGATILDQRATMRLLEPWLGSDLNIDELPVPRLVIVSIDPNAPPDFAAMRAELTAKVPGSALDDHRAWIARLVSRAHATVSVGVLALALMFSATVLTVIFATRGAMAGNDHVVEALHFVGAESHFIGREFGRHFLLAGIRGGAAGGAAAIVTLILFSWWSSYNIATPEGDQATALFGNFSIGMSGYIGVALVVTVVSALTTATSYCTVIAHLRQIET